MKFELKKTEELSPIKKKMTIAVPLKEVESALDRAYLEIQKKAKLKGFRPGKAPRPVLEQYYREDANETALRELIGQSYAEALEQEKLFPVSHPEVQVTEFFDDGKSKKGLTYNAAFELKPEIVIAGYDGLSLTQEKQTVEEKEVTERLDQIRQRYARLVPIQKERKLKVGDLVTLDYNGFNGEKSFTDGVVKDYTVELGKGQLIAEFEKEVMQLSKGKKQDVSLTLPENFTDKSVAGKKVRYEVEVKEVKEKVLPELNDDFAKDLGKFKTVEELKKVLREDLEKDKEHRNRALLREQIVEKLAAKNKFEIPEGMIQMELESMWNNFVGYLKAQGVPPEKAGVNPEEFVKKNREAAQKRVQGALLFDALAKKENIVATPEDAEKRLEEVAQSTGQSVAVLKRTYQSRNLIPQLQESLRAEKTLDFVLKAAKIKTKD